MVGASSNHPSRIFYKQLNLQHYPEVIDNSNGYLVVLFGLDIDNNLFLDSDLENLETFVVLELCAVE